MRLEQSGEALTIIQLYFKKRFKTPSKAKKDFFEKCAKLLWC